MIDVEARRHDHRICSTEWAVITRSRSFAPHGNSPGHQVARSSPEQLGPSELLDVYP
jgi:hypothetical protein